ncbi:LacI family DNA-binding transcriptional regulator [Streptomyces sp. NPDC057950]|uniref:LacI family DNA-binding transcriptional regulator n=1 Tax=Streptomyces sp. NPDC057950 TaxID=3346288 RepID=UPI0036EA4389
MSQPTIRDVAAAAGVAASTVSNYFNHPEKLANTTQERIQEAIGTLGFVPNNVARMLRTKMNPVIGYITSGSSTAGSLEAARAAERRVEEEGMHLLMAHCGSEERERSYLDLFVQQRVAGIMIAPARGTEEELSRIRDHGIPSVVVTRRATSPVQASVSTDHIAGGRLTAEHLIGEGRRRLGLLANDLDSSEIQDHLRGVMSALAAAPGVALEIIRASDGSSHAGAACADQVMQRPPAEQPDGLICTTGPLALGAARAFNSPPQPINPSGMSIVGYGVTAVSPLAEEHIKAVRLPYFEMGEAAVNILFDQLTHTESEDGPFGASETPQIELSPVIVA